MQRVSISRTTLNIEYVRFTPLRIVSHTLTCFLSSFFSATGRSRRSKPYHARSSPYVTSISVIKFCFSSAVISLRDFSLLYHKKSF